jgi:rhamnose utilization protein RhaD (predicted bifunctional aldolase and dehydrogenase)/NAD(P)-dependent dehydrogenase (short-subunit alcohol dehydrogenase family)
MTANKWNEKDLSAISGPDQNLEYLAYSSRIMGSEPDLALHGGGNTSYKSIIRDITGENRNALFIKTSGCELSAMTTGDFVALDLDYIQRLEKQQSLTDLQMAEEFCMHMLQFHQSHASVETLLHAFLPFACISHTHPTAVLALTDRENGDTVVREALGDDIAVIGYARVGLDLAKAAAKAVRERSSCSGLVIMHHGLVCWGKTARESYDATIKIVNRAETYLSKRRGQKQRRAVASDETVKRLYASLAATMRGLLSSTHRHSSETLQPGLVLKPLLEKNIREILDSAGGRALCVTPPLTPDLIVRAGILPMWIDAASFNSPDDFRKQMETALVQYRDTYREYVNRHDSAAAKELDDLSCTPRIVLIPGLGAICTGADSRQAGIAVDITRQAILAKALIADTGGCYSAINEEHLFDMEFRPYQTAKIDHTVRSLNGRVAIVTGSAGAIGRGIASTLLKNGCHVALADLPGDALRGQTEEYRREFGSRVLDVAMDVTDASSVADGFAKVVGQWGGLDIVIVNAGIAHVSSLIDMDLETFRRLERVNVDGTLLTIREAGKVFRQQQLGGDIVLVSTKNVFAPGAKFGAYSATKAAAHQIARIAVVEMADMEVRVNMVSPDAVFSNGATKSGLWAAVGPDRMKARGLDEKGLEEYYRSRNLLKSQVTAVHVANAVMFFVTHQTPTTGATIPVDGGLPDATPR